MESQSLTQQTLQMELSPLNEGFVRTAVTINRLRRGEWEDALEVDFESEVYRVGQALEQECTFLTRGIGAVAFRQTEHESKAVGYGYAFEGYDSVWLGGLQVVSEESGHGVLPAIAQVMLAVTRQRENKCVNDPRCILPSLLAGALDEQEVFERPRLPANPHIADVQLALLTYLHLAEYDVKKA
jgi:hypothetical protein